MAIADFERLIENPALRNDERECDQHRDIERGEDREGAEEPQHVSGLPSLGQITDDSLFHHLEPPAVRVHPYHRGLADNEAAKSPAIFELRVSSARSPF
jgi:hypothetical protein